jgi:hypothetical protein
MQEQRENIDGQANRGESDRWSGAHDFTRVFNGKSASSTMKPKKRKKAAQATLTHTSFVSSTILDNKGQKSKSSSGKKKVVSGSKPSKTSLNSTSKGLVLTQTAPRKKAFSKHGPNLAFLLQCLHEIMKLEKDCELQKINLALHADFNLIDAFGILDQGAAGSVAPAEMLLGMNSLGLT